MRPLYLGGSGFREFAEDAREVFGEGAQVWYTERNGDGIGCVMPEESGIDDLPCFADGYMIFEWIHPNNDFGTGVKPTRKPENDYGHEVIGRHPGVILREMKR